MAFPIPESLFFSGCAWGCAFHIGVYRALQEEHGLNLMSNIKYAGNSAGALIACACALGLNWKFIESVYLELLDSGVNCGVFGKMSRYHNVCMDRIFSRFDENLYKLLENKVFIGITHYFDKYKLVSKWNNNDELRECLHASMHVPFYCEYIPKYNGKRVIDGACSQWICLLNDKTLVIDVFSNKGDICAKPTIKYMDCIKPNLNNYYIMRNDGYIKMKNWNGKYNNKIYYMHKYGINFQKFILICCWILRILEEYKLNSTNKRAKFITVIVIYVLFNRYVLKSQNK